MEDDPVSQRLLEAFCRSGHEVICCSDGPDVWFTAQLQGRPERVPTDDARMDGLQTAEIRQMSRAELLTISSC
jgi:hypothetical protein